MVFLRTKCFWDVKGVKQLRGEQIRAVENRDLGSAGVRRRCLRWTFEEEIGFCEGSKTSCYVAAENVGRLGESPDGRGVGFSNSIHNIVAQQCAVRWKVFCARKAPNPGEARKERKREQPSHFSM